MTEETPFYPFDPELLAPYWRALGEFVFYFARLEHEMHLLVSALAFMKANPGLARAVFQNRKIGDALDVLERIKLELGGPYPAQIESMLSQVRLIMNRRNDILHHGIQLREDGAFVTNVDRVVHPKVRETRTSLRELEELTDDVLTAWATALTFREILQSAPGPHHGEWMKLVERPWRYHVAQPIRQPKSSG